MNESKRSETILLLIWTQAVLATLGSLFYSEIMGYIPCELCWVQRILMYPLVIIYGVALWKKNIQIAIPGIIFSVIGMGVSIYHYALQKVPALHEAGAACGNVPCNMQYVNYFGFITIPFLAGTAFMVITVLHIFLWKYSRR
ncbi:disulfide oxidoreductase [Ornithinibacillus sp. 4-3]|uniref:Probable disulfide formation protein n=1 Tax=Ornithinibacillus sp. 4-3 TaxID=3231488 RepID=A0AB39HPI2_9BACI